MRSFFSGMFFALMIFGTLLSFLQGMWWLMPCALALGWIVDRARKWMLRSEGGP